jgi:hypothetical protein
MNADLLSSIISLFAQSRDQEAAALVDRLALPVLWFQWEKRI